MTQTNLKKLLENIREAEKLKSTDLNDWDPRSRAGMEVARNQAIQALPDMYDAYHSAVQRHSAAVYLTGPESVQTEFAVQAKKIGAVALDAKAFYVAVTRDAAATLGNTGRFTPTEFAHIMYQLRTILSDELKIAEFMRPDLTPLMVRSVSQKVLVDEVAAALVAANGHGLAAIYLARLAAKEALASGYSQDVVPVVVTGASKQEIEALSASGRFTGRTSSTVALDDAKVNEEYVRDILAQHTGITYATEIEAPVLPEPEAVVEKSVPQEKKPKTKKK